jgi:hypothetical protein
MHLTSEQLELLKEVATLRSRGVPHISPAAYPIRADFPARHAPPNGRAGGYCAAPDSDDTAPANRDSGGLSRLSSLSRKRRRSAGSPRMRSKSCAVKQTTFRRPMRSLCRETGCSFSQTERLPSVGMRMRSSSSIPWCRKRTLIEASCSPQRISSLSPHRTQWAEGAGYVEGFQQVGFALGVGSDQHI